MKISVFKKVRFTTAFFLNGVQPCPYCKTSLHRPHDPTWAYFKDILCVIFLIGVILFLLAIIFGTVLGYQTAFVISFWFWVVAAAVVSTIVVVNLICILIPRLYKGIRFNLKRDRHHGDKSQNSDDYRRQ